MMQPDLFYKEWNNTINSDHEVLIVQKMRIY